MKKLLKFLLAMLVAVVIIVGVLFGVHSYNSSRFAVPGANPRDKSSYETSQPISPIEGTYLNGFHFLPTEKRHQGVVVTFGGSEGSPGYDRAKQLWEQGYEVYALFFFGQPNQQESLAEVPLEFFDEVEALIPEGPVTVIGASKGAELTANLAARGAKIDNIVLFTPSEYTYEGLAFGQQEKSSFTQDGEPVPYLPFRNSEVGPSLKMLADMVLGLPIRYREIYSSLPERADNTEAARIPIENFHGQGLLFAGDQDAMWPGDIAAANLAERNPGLEAHVYPGAGHMFSEDITAFGPSWEKMLGGTVADNRTAKQDSDKILLDKLSQWHPAN
ncbi:alpha/beta hydrolase [Corynebacterium hindlerae]|uniref:alpha/beta hydrolase n=1 Tax=Corynebacterium hindlerae TaxID=699041 RepID=UPI003AAC37CD